MLRTLTGHTRQLAAARSFTSLSNFILPQCHCSEVNLIPSRSSLSYYKSKTEEAPDKYTQYEKSFKEWKFVEKLIPPTHVPEAPSDPSADLPSGWRPPNPPNNCSYTIRRTKNHMVPVYVKIEQRGMRRHTHVGKVEGNIWQLEKDLGRYLQSLRPNYPLIIRTNEISRQVIIKGDYVDQVKQWVAEQGF